MGNPHSTTHSTKPAGMKFDQGKPMMDLVRPEFTEGVAAVLTFGAQKYAAHNWTQGIQYSRIIAALDRHLNEIKKGNWYDDESGLPHIDHVGCCVMFLSCFMKWNRTELNDLFTSYEGRFGKKIGESIDLSSDVHSSIHPCSPESFPATERSSREVHDDISNVMSDGCSGNNYDRLSSDDPELVLGDTVGVGR